MISIFVAQAGDEAVKIIQGHCDDCFELTFLLRTERQNDTGTILSIRANEDITILDVVLKTNYEVGYESWFKFSVSCLAGCKFIFACSRPF